MYGVELAIIVFATFVQSLAAPSEAVTLTGLLIFWRVIMGIGIGGDYPLSAVITSEYVLSFFVSDYSTPRPRSVFGVEITMAHNSP